MSYSEIKAKLSSAFSKIGNQNGTTCPTSLDNRATIAHEFYVADALASIAIKRKEVAKEAARSAGILGEEYSEGDTVQTYENEHFSVVAKTATASKTIDKTKLASELIRALGVEKGTKVLESVQKSNKPATSFNFALK